MPVLDVAQRLALRERDSDGAVVHFDNLDADAGNHDLTASEHGG